MNIIKLLTWHVKSMFASNWNHELLKKKKRNGSHPSFTPNKLQKKFHLNSAIGTWKNKIELSTAKILNKYS